MVMLKIYELRVWVRFTLSHLSSCATRYQPFLTDSIESYAESYLVLQQLKAVLQTQELP